MKTSRIFQLLVLVAGVVLAGYATLLTFDARASRRVLDLMHTVAPGQKIEDVRSVLGKEMYEVKEVEGILSLGSVKDAHFCEGKILYWFYVSTPPCRVLEIYTDTDGRVSYVTWHGL